MGASRITGFPDSPFPSIGVLWRAPQLAINLGDPIKRAASRLPPSPKVQADFTSSSASWDEAENRLHIQKAIMAVLMG